MVDNGEPSGSTPFNNVQASIMQKRNYEKRESKVRSFPFVIETN
jgi:hypothetical protein